MSTIQKPPLPDATAVSLRHKQDMVDVIASLLPAGSASRARAEAAALAVDGAIVRAQMGDAASALAGLQRLLTAL